MTTKGNHIIAVALAAILTISLSACSDGSSVSSPLQTAPSGQHEGGASVSGGVATEDNRGFAVQSEPEDGEFICTVIRHVLLTNKDILTDDRNRTVEPTRLGSDICIAFYGNTSTAPREVQSLAITDFKTIINGAEQAYPTARLRFMNPEYYPSQNATIYPFSIVIDNTEALDLGDAPGTYQFEMKINGTHYRSDYYELKADGEIVITEVPASKFNIYDMSYKEWINGNSAGNSNNRGFAQQNEDWIYYTNGSDNDYLYKIRVDSTEKHQLNNEASDGINVVGDWVYYRAYESGKIYKVRTDGTDRTLVCDDIAENVIVVNNWIYYANEHDDLHIYRIRVDGTDKMRVTDNPPPGTISFSSVYGQVDSINVIGNTVVFIKHGLLNNVGYGAADGLPVDILDFVPIEGVTVSQIIIDGDFAYCCSEDNNLQIVKSRYDGAILGPINSDPSAYINVADGWIYYCNLGDDGCLYKIRTDGTERAKLNSDSSENINIAGNWIYYNNMSDNGTLYRIRTDGTERQVVE